jgi:hypothetical protein
MVKLGDAKKGEGMFDNAFPFNVELFFGKIRYAFIGL